MTAALDLTGKTFGRLRAVARAANGPRGQARWKCECLCGKSSEVASSSLRRGFTKSCGCLMREVRESGDSTRKHGMRHSKEYEAWRHMRSRCTKTYDISYPRYGARGIKVCARWMESFEAFLEDVGPSPSPRHSIERLDSDGDYEPNNCTWATLEQQARNKRNTRYVEFGGQRKCLADWCDEFNVRYPVVASRLDRGWPPELAFFAHSEKLAR